MFTRYHEAGKTKIRDHQYEDARLCKKIVGYDANALYLSTIQKGMPCGKGKVFHFQKHREAAWALTKKLKAGTWFGLAKVDIEIPERLRPKFKDMCPFFLNKEVLVKAVPQQMLDYLKKTGRKHIDAKKLVGALSAKKLLLYAPLLRWYVDHGAHISAVSRRTKARRIGDLGKKEGSSCGGFSNCWETAGTGRRSKRWSGKQTSSTPKTRRWSTEPYKARTSLIWKRTGRRKSWKAESQRSQSSDRSRLESLSTSWRSC